MLKLAFCICLMPALTCACCATWRCDCSKSTPAAVHVMEDALRWGVEHIFSRHRYPTQPASDMDTAAVAALRPNSATTPATSQGDVKMEEAASPSSPNHMQEAAAAGSSAAASPHSTPNSVSPEPSMQSPFGAPEQQHRSKPKVKASPTQPSSSAFQPVYTDSVIDKLVHWSASVFNTRGQTEPSGQQPGDHSMPDAANKPSEHGSPAGSTLLANVLGSGWDCVKAHEWSQAQMDDDSHGDEGKLCSVQ